MTDKQANILKENAQLRARVAELEALINSPEIEDFIKGVSIEMPHQTNRWGASHDAFKTTSDWLRLVLQLLGKASEADWAGDLDKLKHHIITSSAALGNFHAAISRFEKQEAQNA